MACIRRTFAATPHCLDARTVSEFAVEKTMPDTEKRGKDATDTFEIQVKNGCAVMTTGQAIAFARGLLELLPPRNKWSDWNDQ